MVVSFLSNPHLQLILDLEEFVVLPAGGTSSKKKCQLAEPLPNQEQILLQISSCLTYPLYEPLPNQEQILHGFALFQFPT